MDDDKDLKEEEETSSGTLSESALEAFDEDAEDDESIDALAEKEFAEDDEEEAEAFFDVPPEDRW